jgi:hypothetical protein
MTSKIVKTKKTLRQRNVNLGGELAVARVLGSLSDVWTEDVRNGGGDWSQRNLYIIVSLVGTHPKMGRRYLIRKTL